MRIDPEIISAVLVAIVMIAGIVYGLRLIRECQKANIRYQNKPIQEGDIFARWSTEERCYDFAFIVTKMISEDYFEANLYSLPVRVRHLKTISSSILLVESGVLDRYVTFEKAIKFSEGEIRRMGFERI